MSDLAKCGGESCNPVLQVRGEMGPGDYRDVYLPDGQPDLDYYKKVELIDPGPDGKGGNKLDVRVLCKACGLASGWFPQHFDNAPDAGRDYLVSKIWAGLAAEKHTKDEMLATMTKQFGTAAVQKHFGLAL